MYLSSLEVINFRNLEKLDLEFSPSMNIFFGNNAQGKTNILESIYLLAVTRSHRTKNINKIIKHDQEFSSIKGRVIDNLSSFTLEMFLGKEGKKAKVNFLEENKLSRYLGKLNVVLFSPEDLQLVKGSPAGRRKFMDMEFGQISSSYLKRLSKYNKIINAKNKYLKIVKNKIDDVFLDSIDEMLIEVGSKIIFDRMKYIDELSNISNDFLKLLTNNKEHLKIKYKTIIPASDKLKLEDIEKSFKKKLIDSRETEIKQKVSSVGPHRDDLEFLVNDLSVSNFGSQGQQRSVVLALKISELDFFKDKTGEFPILLLDDVLSELDSSRQEFLINSIDKEVQTFITTPNSEEEIKGLIKDSKIFNIVSGNVTNI